MKRSESSQRSMEGLRLVSVCPLCSSKNASTQSHVIDVHEDTSLVHLSCGKCRRKILVQFRMSTVGVQCVGIVTDLSLEDARRLMKDRSVDIDDVLDVHEALNDEGFLVGIREQAVSGASH